MEMVVNNSFRNKRSSSALLVTMTLAFLAVLFLGNSLGSISFEMDKTVFAFADLEVSVILDMEALMGESKMEEEIFGHWRSMRMRSTIRGGKRNTLPMMTMKSHWQEYGYTVRT